MTTENSPISNLFIGAEMQEKVINLRCFDGIINLFETHSEWKSSQL